MKSKIAEADRNAMIEDARRQTPEEKLAAYMQHSQLIIEFAEAGKKALGLNNKPRPKRHPFIQS